MKIEVELTKAEEIYFTSCSILRVVKSAIEAVPHDYEHFGDLHDLGDIMEPLRFKLADAIVRAKQKEYKK